MYTEKRLYSIEEIIDELENSNTNFNEINLSGKNSLYMTVKPNLKRGESIVSSMDRSVKALIKYLNEDTIPIFSRIDVLTENKDTLYFEATSIEDLFKKLGYKRVVEAY